MTGRLVKTWQENGLTFEVWSFPSVLAADPPIPGQMTVEEALADASTGAQEGRWRDQPVQTDTK